METDYYLDNWTNPRFRADVLSSPLAEEWDRYMRILLYKGKRVANAGIAALRALEQEGSVQLEGLVHTYRSGLADKVQPQPESQAFADVEQYIDHFWNDIFSQRAKVRRQEEMFEEILSLWKKLCLQKVMLHEFDRAKKRPKWSADMLAEAVRELVSPLDLFNPPLVEYLNAAEELVLDERGEPKPEWLENILDILSCFYEDIDLRVANAHFKKTGKERFKQPSGRASEVCFKREIPKHFGISCPCDRIEWVQFLQAWQILKRVPGVLDSKEPPLDTREHWGSFVEKFSEFWRSHSRRWTDLEHASEE